MREGGKVTCIVYIVKFCPFLARYHLKAPNKLLRTLDLFGSGSSGLWTGRK
jgi:hypothetical protein